MRPLLLALALALASTACATRVDVPRPPAPAPAPLPPFVVAGERAPLTLADHPKVVVARPRPGLPLRVGRMADGRPWAVIDGAVQVAGVVAQDDLAVVVCAPGPVVGPFYAGNDTRLALRSGVEGGRVRVAGRVAVRARPFDAKQPGSDEFRHLDFTADLPVERLCAGPQPKRHAGTAADPDIARGYGEPDEEDFPKGTRVADVPKGTPLTVLDRPGGAPLHTLPAEPWGFSVVWLGREGAWDRVAIGGGPYLVGYTTPIEPRDETYGVGGLGLLGAMVDLGPFALHTSRLARAPLHHVPAGTSVVVYGVERARLLKPGFARVTGGPREGFVHVVAAVDDGVTVEGWVPQGAIGPRVEEKRRSAPAP